jgi:hypothetical protein
VVTGEADAALDANVNLSNIPGFNVQATQPGESILIPNNMFYTQDELDSAVNEAVSKALDTAREFRNSMMSPLVQRSHALYEYQRLLDEMLVYTLGSPQFYVKLGELKAFHECRSVSPSSTVSMSKPRKQEPQ